MPKVHRPKHIQRNVASRSDLVLGTLLADASQPKTAKLAAITAIRKLRTFLLPGARYWLLNIQMDARSSYSRMEPGHLAKVAVTTGMWPSISVPQARSLMSRARSRRSAKISKGFRPELS